MPEDTFVTVYLDQNLQKPLDYAVPQDMHVEVGMRALVPLRSKLVKATIAAIKSKTDFPQVKAISKILSPQGELSPHLWKLAEWMSHYYATPLQKVLKCFIPPNVRKEVKEKTKRLVTLVKTHAETQNECARLRVENPKAADLLELLLQNPKGVFLSDIKVSKSVMDALHKWVQIQLVTANEICEDDFFPSFPKKLNESQEKAFSSICGDLEKSTFAAHLIHGITGSGKTEIYLQAIAKALELGKSAMLLVPEIALTSQTIERFRARFPHKIAILHHKRSLGERSSAWEDLRSGKVQIAIGARSAIFCPIQNLGLIIIDEEHDSSYKQSDEIPCYQGRDIAVMRAYFEKCVVVLGSATPSLESRYNAETGKYKLHVLKTRAGSACLPNIQIIDMKLAMDKSGGFTHFCPELINAMKERVEKGEQILLLLNKRGYHRMQMCSGCRSIIKCPHCDLSLTYHRGANLLKCHFCDYALPPPRSCPSCNEPSLEFKGFGTEHVERSLHAVMPDIRTLRMDRDTIQKKHDHEEIFKQFRSHKADVLIGTQMIAKGFHFPSVTLVGVLNIDSSLTIPDFRSPEHVFQLLTQVAGRAGREETPGTVILQTFMPDHPLIKKVQAQDFDAFFTSEIAERKMFHYPPFCHLAKMTFSSTDQDAIQKEAESVRAYLKKELPPDVEIFPLVPSGHPKLKDLYRFQLLIKTPKISLVAKVLNSLQSSKIKIDIDPNSTFF